MTEETYPPKAYRPKHSRLSDLKAEALKKDRRKKLTLAKFVGMAENTAHPRVVIPELRQEFELVGAAHFALWKGGCGRALCLWQGVLVGGTRGHLQLKATCLTYPIPPSQGPCRRHMEASLQELKSSQRMVPRAVHLPNCDRKGFYKRKQVRAPPRQGCCSHREALFCHHPRWRELRFFFHWVMGRLQ